MRDIRFGKFTSPYLMNFEERFSINNKNISWEELDNTIVSVAPIVDLYNSEHELKVKWFGIITSIAIKYFADSKCDIVVLETGIRRN